MSFLNKDLYPENSTVLVAPLCWGLGHASRCVPIIHRLLDRGCEITLASDGQALEFLKETFPSLPALDLPSYNINYHGKNMVLDMIRQLPKIYNAFKAEQKAIDKIYSDYNWDYIISDHRYGVHHKKAKNIFLCHQLQIQSDNSLLSLIANKVHHRLLHSFDQIWVPDYDDHRLAGNLSVAKNLINVHYIGALSRLEKLSIPQVYDLAVILSGPEPARSIFEKKVLKVVPAIQGKVLLIRGTRTEQSIQPIKNLDVIDFAVGAQFNKLISSSSRVLCRSGYSSIMDLFSLSINAILVPTPGQTEQEYLGKWHAKNPTFSVLNENQLDQLVL